MSYLDELENIKENVDKVINNVKTNQMMLGNKFFLFPLVILPFKNIKGLKDRYSLFISFFSSIIPAILVMIGIPIANHLISDTNKQIPIKYLLILIGITYLFSLIISFQRMVTIGDKNFHIDAYRRVKKKEFEFFSNFFNKNLTYSGLYDHLRDLSVKGEINTKENLNKLQQQMQNMENNMLYYQEENAELQEQLIQLEEAYNDEINETIEEFENYIGEYEEFVEAIEKSEGFSAKLLTKATNSLFRLHDGSFNEEDLRLISDYSVYQLNGDKLELIKNGGPPEVPKMIELDSKDQRWNAMLQAASSESEDEIVMNKPRLTCAMVSKYVKMPNNVTWVYNFHFYHSDSLYSDVIRDMETLEPDRERRLVHIKSPEITALIKALCYNVYMNFLQEKEAAIK